MQKLTRLSLFWRETNEKIYKHSNVFIKCSRNANEKWHSHTSITKCFGAFLLHHKRGGILNEVWVEKYRPKSLKDVIGQKHIVKRLMVIAENVKTGKSTLPHFLLAGKQGTGKTSIVQAFIRDMYGDEFRYLEMNASDNRKIDDVRGQIKKFCRTSPWDDKLNIVFLDEADGLTPQAQEALRRIMEKYAGTTRFILSCNYLNKVIDPIRSRCAILNFYPLKSVEVAKLINRVAKSESIPIKKSAIKMIGFFSRGDARLALNTFNYLAGSQNEIITDDDVYNHSWRVDVIEVDKLINYCLFEPINNLSEIIDKIDTQLMKFYQAGFSELSMVDAFYIAVKDNPEYKPRMKAKLFTLIGDLDYRITVGCNPDIQIRTFLFSIVYSRYKKAKK